MNRREKRRRLNRFRLYSNRIRELENLTGAAEDLAERRTPSQGGGNGPRRSVSRVELGVIALLDAEAQMDVLRGLQEQEAERIKQAAGALPPKDRDIILKHYLEMISVSDIAAGYGITRAAAEKRLRRAIDRIEI